MLIVYCLPNNLIHFVLFNVNVCITYVRECECVHCTLWSKNGTHKILTDTKNYFTIRIRKTFVIILSPKIPPHLKRVTTLPYKMPVS